MRLSNISIHHKLMLLVLVLVCGISATAGLAFHFSQQDILNGRKEQLRSIVRAGSSQIQALQQQLRSGRIDRPTFEQRLREVVRASGLAGHEYLFLYDRNGVNIAHPTLPELEGSHLLEQGDRLPARIVLDAFAVARQQGSHYWRYRWPRPEGGATVPKLGYAEYLPELELVLGSGVYLDDVYRVYRERSFLFGLLSLLVLLISLLLALRISRNISRPVQTLSAQMQRLARGEPGDAPQETGRQDEIGDMARTVALFREQLQENRRLRHAHDKAQFLETFDPVTQLYNRQALGDALQREISRRTLSTDPISILVVRFDLLRNITIQLGSEKRDRVLQEMAHRFHELLHVDDVLARLAEDTFCILLANIDSTSHLNEIIHQLLDEVSRPLTLSEGSLQIAGRIGISLYPQDGDQEFQLIGRAEIAAREARRQERSYMYFNALQDNIGDQQIELWQELQKALEIDQFHLVFQPLYELAGNQPVAAEVLIRWHHPQRGFISPATFIPLAEQSGLISSLDAWVLNAVARQCREWLDQQLPLPRLAVNLSGISFLRPDFEQLLCDTFRRHRVPLALLELELTEGILIDDLNRISDRIRRIRATGSGISIDDFGTGYSSLSRLKNLAVDHVKIDRSFIEDLENGIQDRKIVEAIILMSHGLGLKVVAEGVETQAQLDLLRQMKCDIVQGYFLNRPLQKADFEALLEQDLVIEVE